MTSRHGFVRFVKFHQIYLSCIRISYLSHLSIGHAYTTDTSGS